MTRSKFLNTNSLPQIYNLYYLVTIVLFFKQKQDNKKYLQVEN